MLKHLKSCLEVEKGNYFPTPPPPAKCNYNKYIVFERQQAIRHAKFATEAKEEKSRRWKETQSKPLQNPEI